MKRSIMFAAILVALVASPTWGGQVVNPGFEQPQDPKTDGPVGPYLWFGNTFDFVGSENGVTPIEGVQMVKYLETGATSNLRQVIALDGFTGGPVTLSADIYHTAASSPISQFRLLLANINTGAPFSNADFDNNVLVQSWNSVPLGSWTTLSLSAVVPPGTAFLGVEVSYLSGGQLTGYADNVRVDGVPEPSSIVLAVLGLLGLVAWGWRRRKR